MVRITYMFSQMHSVSLQSNIVNYWHGMNNTAFQSFSRICVNGDHCRMRIKLFKPLV